MANVITIWYAISIGAVDHHYVTPDASVEYFS